MSNLDRREFLTRTSAATAAVGLTGPLAAFHRPPRSGEPIRWAVIGTGSRGGDHLRTLSRLDDARVVAVCDVYPPHLAKGLRLAGGAASGVSSYSDHREMLQRGDIDAVSVATPIHAHAEVSIAALEAGVNVLCEKSMAHTIEQGKRMVEAVRRSGKLFQVGLQRRYTGFYRRARQLVAEGRIGRVMHATLQWHRNASWRRPVPAPHGEWTAEALERHINHRLYWNTSGGLMAELGSHQIDVLNWMLQETPAAVMGVGGIDSWRDGREVWDNINLVFEYASGCKATYTSIQANAFDGATEKLLGDKGTILLGRQGRLFPERAARSLEPIQGAERVEVNGKSAFDFTSGATQTSGQGDAGDGETLKTPQMWLDGTHMEFSEFMRCIREGTKPLCDEVEGYKDSVCVILANQAMQEGRRVEFGKDLWDVLG